ncbi:unnamed protein product [Microthlaspi erraticum]|uniref:Uncharacterized protein n=1 Tax=Microthlaspi erraticum TaxID=1685480 RepID=A0A6D2ILJ3_9BRAS|nr:unnamed protein product [Microthlaspi erraticum]
MRIEGEKGVKTQSAPKHWPRTRKVILAEQFSFWPTVRSSREGIAVLGRIHSCATENVRAPRANRERSRDRPILYRNGPTVPVDPGNIRSASADSLDQTNLADQIARPRQNPSAIGPKLF